MAGLRRGGGAGVGTFRCRCRPVLLTCRGFAEHCAACAARRRRVPRRPPGGQARMCLGWQDTQPRCRPLALLGTAARWWCGLWPSGGAPPWGVASFRRRFLFLISSSSEHLASVCRKRNVLASRNIKKDVGATYMSMQLYVKKDVHIQEVCASLKSLSMWAFTVGKYNPIRFTHDVM